MKTDRNSRECLKGSKFSSLAEREDAHIREEPLLDAVPKVTDGLCSRGLFTVLLWPQSSEWDRGRWNLLLRNLLTLVFFVSTGCTKEPEETVRGPKGYMTLAGSGSAICLCGPGHSYRDGNELYYQATTCSTRTQLHSPFLLPLSRTWKLQFPRLQYAQENRNLIIGMEIIFGELQWITILKVIYTTLQPLYLLVLITQHPKSAYHIHYGVNGKSEAKLCSHCSWSLKGKVKALCFSFGGEGGSEDKNWKPHWMTAISLWACK